MNNHDDLLNNDEMCSFYEDDIENMCSNKEYDTYGDGGSFILQKIYPSSLKEKWKI